MLMSDFFSLTVTVRAPRPSFSRRACACSPIGPAASRSWSRVVRSSGKVDSALICLAGAFSATGRSSMPRASWCSDGPDRGAEDVGGLGVGQGGERTDGVDAEPVQLLLGHRADAPQPPHRKPVQQHAFLVAAHHPDAVGLGQPRGDLGDLLARSGPDGGDQPGLVANLGPQVLAERLDVARPTPRPVRPARRTPRRRRAVRGRARRRGRCRARGGWPRRRPRRAAAAPPRPRRPGGGPDASASPTAPRTPGPRSWPRPPRRGRRARRPAPADRAGWAGSAARRTRRTRPCRSAAPSGPRLPMLGASLTRHER